MKSLACAALLWFGGLVVYAHGQALPFPGPGAAAAAGPIAICTGGTQTTVSGKIVHTFTANGTLTCSSAVNVTYCIIAGGGGSGTSTGGGGGGGGMLVGSITASVSNPITVGGGGPSATAGVNSTALSLTANGGGLGGTGGGSPTVGGNGGAGGGGGGAISTQAGGTGSQGGNGASGASSIGGGGGGGGPSGVTATTVNGGNGTTCAINGTVYAGGGGGNPGGTGGTGGGANSGVTAAANTGGGGGGGGLAGGSGIVIVREDAAAACWLNTDGSGAYSNVVVLFHFDNNGTDNGPSGRNVTLNGAATYSSTQSKFGGFAYLGTTSSSFARTSGTPPNIAGDVTIEAWVYQPSTATWTSATRGIISDNNTTFTWYWSVFTANNWEMVNSPGSTEKTFAETAVTNTWRHMAWVRASNVWTFYLNGVSQTVAGTNWTANIGNGTTQWDIGGNAAASIFFPGFIDEFRVSNMARYTMNFTPPTLAFCNN
jgi:hypothetical protein